MAYAWIALDQHCNDLPGRGFPHVEVKRSLDDVLQPVPSPIVEVSDVPVSTGSGACNMKAAEELPRAPVLVGSRTVFQCVWHELPSTSIVRGLPSTGGQLNWRAPSSNLLDGGETATPGITERESSKGVRPSPRSPSPVVRRSHRRSSRRSRSRRLDPIETRSASRQETSEERH